MHLTLSMARANLGVIRVILFHWMARVRSRVNVSMGSENMSSACSVNLFPLSILISELRSIKTKSYGKVQRHKALMHFF